MSDGRTIERWTYYRLEDDTICLVIGETDDFAWALDPETGEQWDVDRAEFVDGLMDDSIEKVEPAFEPAEAGASARTEGAGA